MIPAVPLPSGAGSSSSQEHECFWSHAVPGAVREGIGRRSGACPDDDDPLDSPAPFFKMIPASVVGSVGRLRRFLRNSRRAARITHSRMVPFTDTVEQSGMVALARRYVEGTDLGRIIRERKAHRNGNTVRDPHPLAKLPDDVYLRRMLPLLDQVLVLAALVHRAGGVHGGFKPANCLVDGRGHVWVTDFGFSGLAGFGAGLRVADVPATAGGGVFADDVGDLRPAAPGFVSPEEWAGAPADQVTDVFCLGVTLYQALTLDLPYGTAPVALDRPLPPAPSRRRPTLPGALDAPIQIAVHPDRRRRYPSAVELLDAWRLARGV